MHRGERSVALGASSSLILARWADDRQLLAESEDVAEVGLSAQEKGVLLE